jgi:hypothetical protein
VSDTDTTSEKTTARELATAHLMPLLAGLDKTARQLERDAEAGQQVTQGRIDSYALQAQHIQHLMRANDIKPADVAGAERGHHGDGEKGFAARGLDHANNPRPYEPTPAADTATGQDREDEHEIDL